MIHISTKSSSTCAISLLNKKQLHHLYQNGRIKSATNRGVERLSLKRRKSPGKPSSHYALHGTTQPHTCFTYWSCPSAERALIPSDVTPLAPINYRNYAPTFRNASLVLIWCWFNTLFISLFSSVCVKLVTVPNFNLFLPLNWHFICFMLILSRNL